MRLGIKVRYWFLFIFWVLLTAIVSARLIYLVSHERAFLLGQSKARVEREVVLTAKRGRILDRNKEVLAMSRPVHNLWTSPKLLLAEPQGVQKTATALQLDQEALRNKLEKNKHKDFYYLARNLEKDAYQALKAAQIKTVYSSQSFARFYPEGMAGAQLVGTVDIDENGIEGIEYLHNSILSGRPGFAKYMINPFGEIVETIERKDPESGQDIQLTVDKSIQYHAYEALKSGVKRTQAKSAHAVVLSVENGDILAATGYPSFNPQAVKKAMAGQMRNRVFTDLYEPGSTFKTMTMAYVLEKNTEEQLPKKIQTAPGQWKVGKNIIRDVHNYGQLSIGEVLVKSSNIAIAKLLLKSPSGFVTWLQSSYQIGQAVSQIFPGMATSTIHSAYGISDFDLATIGFGYGVSVTPLQLSQIYLSIANGGYWVNPRLTYTTKHQLPSSQRVLSQKTATQLSKMLHQATLPTGTARNAAIPGLNVAGKTGTTHLYADGQYQADRYIASFAGFAPYEQPKYVVVVIVEEPEKSLHFGGQAAAPIFKDIIFSSQFVSLSNGDI